MKEYHLHKSQLPEGSEQIFITSIIRDEEDESVSIEEIFVITSIGDKEITTRVDVDNLLEKIILNPNNCIPVEKYDEMYEMIDSVTPEKVKLQNQIDLYEHQCPDHKVTEDLIFASDMATYCKGTEFDSLVDSLLDTKTIYNK